MQQDFKEAVISCTAIEALNRLRVAYTLLWAIIGMGGDFEAERQKASEMKQQFLKCFSQIPPGTALKVTAYATLIEIVCDMLDADFVDNGECAYA